MGFTFVLLAVGASAQQHTMPGGAGDADLIKSAMMAAPPAVSGDAAVVAVGEDGKLRTVREGKNGFTCLPDNPASPGPDPMCGDANAMAWAMAWIEHREPAKNQVGLMYMLAGGTDASNTDPHAAKPTADNHWIETGPHVMILGAKGMLADYPRAADPDTKAPYVMWADTPYEHVMVPVQ
jgi:hypothetical protein